MKKENIKISAIRIGPNQYQLLKHVIYLIDNEKYIVPAGFKTDFASIPKIFWSILPPDSDYTHAAVLHDYLLIFKRDKLSKKKIDKLFYKQMRLDGVNIMKAKIIYYSVRIFGK